MLIISVELGLRRIERALDRADRNHPDHAGPLLARDRRIGLQHALGEVEAGADRKQELSLQQLLADLLADPIDGIAGLLKPLLEEVVVELGPVPRKPEIFHIVDGVVDHLPGDDQAMGVAILPKHFERDQVIDRGLEASLLQKFTDLDVREVTAEALEVLVELGVGLFRGDRHAADPRELGAARRAAAAAAERAEAAEAARAEAGDDDGDQRQEQNREVAEFLAGHGGPDEGDLRGS